MVGEGRKSGRNVGRRMLRGAAHRRGMTDISEIERRGVGGSKGLKVNGIIHFREWRNGGDGG